jgi:hypothetical protein
MMTDETTLIILMGKGRSTFILPREIVRDEENEKKNYKTSATLDYKVIQARK